MSNLIIDNDETFYKTSVPRQSPLYASALGEDFRRIDPAGRHPGMAETINLFLKG